jgi:hypothetical protein
VLAAVDVIPQQRPFASEPALARDDIRMRARARTLKHELLAGERRRRPPAGALPVVGQQEASSGAHETNCARGGREGRSLRTNEVVISWILLAGGAEEAPS